MGLEQLLILLILALILFGPDDLPVIARTAGRFVGQMRNLSDEIRREFEHALNEPTLSTPPKSSTETHSEDEVLSYDEPSELTETKTLSTEEIIPLIQTLCSHAVGSSLSYDALISNPEYQAILQLGDDALSVMLHHFETSDTDGLTEYVMAMACSEIQNPGASFDYLSGRQWYLEKYVSEV